MSAPINLSGKNALITGSSRGLGLDAAEGLVRAQISIVFITSRKDKAVQEAKKYLESIAAKYNPTCQIIGVAADIANDQGLDALYKVVVSKVDKLHILIANAGASWGEGIETHPASAVRKILDLNVTAVFTSIQKHLSLLEKDGTPSNPARILITGSIAGISADMGMGGTYGYVASKAGVNHLGRALALELGPRNITVNVLAPGFFPTKMSNGLLEVIGDTYKENNPRGRLGNSQDFMGIVQFLCGGVGSDYLNGVVLPIDGGSHLAGRLSKM
ncbi:hypothetical protein BABINDRAFT_162777 [Babjeviella inositovora NRRL Y-12698]|uniref:Uncharacterized protein n=1 Tax=Babjeviella inositovora NRRL Y-12698 TaxID=984486 RepID=A0A1E3QLK6_9ASCO|nr:uncharacterized protein BABINDRAFT_162777 [Babjeviella inositovora NRRL Y-12698]ODQ78571.1 hypothetical protein BABINDRAFT_162777 [Babjeviella inositovora NRRL Y-12698]